MNSTTDNIYAIIISIYQEGVFSAGKNCLSPKSDETATSRRLAVFVMPAQSEVKQLQRVDHRLDAAACAGMTMFCATIKSGIVQRGIAGRREAVGKQAGHRTPVWGAVAR
jgi:hypothetical protein